MVPTLDLIFLIFFFPFAFAKKNFRSLLRGFFPVLYDTHLLLLVVVVVVIVVGRGVFVVVAGVGRVVRVVRGVLLLLLILVVAVVVMALCVFLILAASVVVLVGTDMLGTRCTTHFLLLRQRQLAEVGKAKTPVGRE